MAFNPLVAAALAQHVASGWGGAVAAAEGRATRSAIDVLVSGGNAVDATVAAAAVLGVTRPFSGGIGGGGFMLIYLKEQDEVVSIDFREAAPASAMATMFLDSEGQPTQFYPERVSSGAAVGVPGTVAGWEAALSDYGTRTLASLLAPAIGMASGGFEIDERFAADIAANRERFVLFPATAALFLDGDGTTPLPGTVHQNPDLAATLRLIAEAGAAAFYRGPIGEDVIRTINSPLAGPDPDITGQGAGMTMADLGAYRALRREVIVSEYGGYTVFGMGPPSAGGLTVALILNLLAGFELDSLPIEEALHLMLEASRLAYADRSALMADADFVHVPVDQLLSAQYAASRGTLVGEDASDHALPGLPVSHPFSHEPAESDSTTNITVADRHGNIVVYTFSVEALGGSGMVVPGRGFLLNNQLTDFDPLPGVPNSAAPSKRPRSSMSPTIVFEEGRPVLALGAAGGATIITTVVQILLATLDFDEPLPAALAAPRLSQQNRETTVLEPATSEALVQDLLARGHSLGYMEEIGEATGIAFALDGTMTAVAEPQRRGGGTAMVVHPR